MGGSIMDIVTYALLKNKIAENDASVEAEAERAQAAEQELYEQLVAIGTNRIKPLENKVNSLAEMLELLTVDAPEAFDTLKEIADWIKQDETATASLIQTVSAKADKSYVDEKYAQITSIDEGSIEARPILIRRGKNGYKEIFRFSRLRPL